MKVILRRIALTLLFLTPAAALASTGLETVTSSCCPCPCCPDCED